MENLKRLITFSVTNTSNGFDVSIAESLEDIYTTPKKTVVMLPEFGNDFFKLVDKRMDDEWLIDLKRELADATIWETRITLKKVTIKSFDVAKGSVAFRLDFDDNSYLEGVLNGFN